MTSKEGQTSVCVKADDFASSNYPLLRLSSFFIVRRERSRIRSVANPHRCYGRRNSDAIS
jgi:hypothetical protein